MTKIYIEIFEALEKRFPVREYALLHEVRDAAGFSASRSADAVAINLWPSRGHAIHGFEIKCGRGDWLKEMKSPHKAENIFQYCDHFWLVASSDQIVLKEEVPKSWGLLIYKGGKITTKKEAPTLKPKPISMTFFGAILKRATTSLVRPHAVEKIVQAKVATELEISAAELRRAVNKYENLKTVVDEFQKASGIQLYNNEYWHGDGKQIGGIVKIIKDGQGDITESLKRLQSIQETAKKIINNIDETIKLVTPK